MYKKFIIITLSAFFTLVAIHMSLLLAVDPLSITTFEIAKKEFYVKEMRFQAAGVIRNHQFNSAIVGTSMAENFDAKEASNILGGQFLNLSLSGAILEERKVVIEYIIEEKEVNTLIISFDGATALQRNAGIPLTNWSYLYDSNYIDDVMVYTNNKYLPYMNCHTYFDSQLFASILGKCPVDKVRADVYSLTEWYSDPSKQNRFGGLSKWMEHANNLQARASLDKILRANKKIQRGNVLSSKGGFNLHNFDEVEKNLIPIIQNNPKINFILYFPPYSLLYYAMEQQSNNYQFENYKTFVKKATLEMEKYANVQLHWFSDQDFILDIANYKDLTHFHPRYHSLFLKHFKDKKSLITSKNFESKIIDLEKKAKDFDFAEVVRAIDR